MKLRRVHIEKVRSFLNAAELLIDGDISIVIGPNGGGKTNLLDIVTTSIRQHLLFSWTHRPQGTADEPERREMLANDMFRTNAR